jgi:hypothetical protein
MSPAARRTDVREIAAGLFDWQAEHPQWEEGAPWGPVVSSHAVDDGANVLLFDPIDVPAELLARATAVVLTAPWHERDARELGLPVYSARPDTGQDLIDAFGVDPARVEGFVSEDLHWLIHEGDGDWHEIGPGAAPFGLEAFRGRTHNDLVLWAPSARAVIGGDSLADWGDGLKIQAQWLTASADRDAVAASLRPLLDRPVEHVLPAHGMPTDGVALERALAS